MRAGDLRHAVTIQARASEARNSFGEETFEWETHQQVWAAIEPLSGRELIDAHEVQAEITLRVRIRSLSGVVPDMRVLFGARILEIQAVIDLEERGHEMHLMCREVVE